MIKDLQTNIKHHASEVNMDSEWEKREDPSMFQKKKKKKSIGFRYYGMEIQIVSTIIYAGPQEHHPQPSLLQAFYLYPS